MSVDTHDEKFSLEFLKQKVEQFCELRDWGQFHGAKDLAIGLVTESSELLEIFRFKNPEEVEELFLDSSRREDIEDEMADILFFLLRLSGRYGIDLSRASHRKMEKNELRYPVEEFKGKNHKSRR